MKHYDNGNGYEFCSGREGWSKRKTTTRAEVTCKNCLKAMARDAEKTVTIEALDHYREAVSNSADVTEAIDAARARLSH